METFEMRYFVAVARHESVRGAAAELGVSPASLSKAVARLEDELQARLFERQGRGLSLSPAGRALFEEGSRIVQLEEALKVKIRGRDGALSVVIGGPEVLLSHFGSELARRIQERYPAATFSLRAMTEDEAKARLRSREIHFAIVSSEPEAACGSRLLGETSFVTVAGMNHPLMQKGGAAKVHNIESVLGHAFVSPSEEILGRVGARQSPDGWRDDQFPRKIAYSTASLKIIEDLVCQGMALAYLPEHVAEPHLRRKNWGLLKISGCPYVCKQKIRLLTRAPIELGWIRQVF